MFYSSKYLSPIGAITLVSDGNNLTVLKLEKHRFFSELTKGCIEGAENIPALAAGQAWLGAYFSGKKPAIDHLPLAPCGSPFRQSVWRILCEIPYGQCITYGDIAKKLAFQMNKPCMSARAVGGAVGHNPISIIIPCHRVVGANGSLTGYGGGINNKIRLLTHECVDISLYSIPTKGTAL